MSRDFDYEVFKKSNEEYVVDLEYRVTLIRKTIKVIFTSRHSILDTWDNELATSELASLLPTYIQYSEGTKAATEQVTAAGEASKYLILILLIPLAITGSLGVFWNLIDVLQILAFILFLNVHFPLNIT